MGPLVRNNRKVTMKIMKRAKSAVPAAAGALAFAAVLGSMPTAAFAADEAAPATAADAVATPAAAIVDADFAAMFTDITSIEQNVRPDGMLDVTQGVVVVGGNLVIPATAKGGDTVALTLDNGFSFRTFQNLEIKDSAGTLLATASATVSKLTITFAPAVDNLQNVSGMFNVTIRGQHLTNEDNTQVLNLIAPDGTKLGPNTTHTMYRQLPNASGLLMSTGIVNGTEIGVGVHPQYSPQSTKYGVIDPSTVKFTVTAQERDAVVNEDFNFTYRWIDENGQLFGQNIPGVVVKKVDNQTMELTLPAGIDVPDNAYGVRINGNYVVGKASSDYHFAMKMEAQGRTLYDTKNNIPENKDEDRDDQFRWTITSAKLDGVAEGELRPSKTSITKEITSDASRILVGDTVSYKIVTTNEEATRLALGIVTTDTLPADVEFVKADGGAKAANGKIVWPAVDIAGGESVTHTVDVKVLDATADLFTNKVANVGENTCFVGDTTGSICAADAAAKLVRPGVELDKKVVEVQDTNEDGYTGNAGDTIVYGFEVTNTGNTAEKSVKLTDELLGLSDYEVLTEPLAAGKSVTAAEQQPGDFSHVITEDEAQAGNVHNAATVTIPDGEDTDEVDQPTGAPAIDLTKEVAEVADTNNNGVVGDPGDVISWTMSIENTGNVALDELTLTDELLGVDAADCLEDGTVLEVGDTVTCKGEFTYEITKADADAGKVVNVATATTPGAESEDSTETSTRPAPAKQGPLAQTGAANLAMLGGAGAVALLGGGIVLALSKRKRATAAVTGEGGDILS